jgi:hypothetical protein
MFHVTPEDKEWWQQNAAPQYAEIAYPLDTLQRDPGSIILGKNILLPPSIDRQLRKYRVMVDRFPLFYGTLAQCEQFVVDQQLRNKSELELIWDGSQVFVACDPRIELDN